MIRLYNPPQYWCPGGDNDARDCEYGECDGCKHPRFNGDDCPLFDDDKPAMSSSGAALFDFAADMIRAEAGITAKDRGER